MTPQSISESEEKEHSVLEAVEECLENQDPAGAKDLLESLPPADAAAVLDALDTAQLEVAFRLLDLESEADVLAELEERTVQRLAEITPASLQEAAELMEPDEVADVLEMLTEDQAESLLDAVSNETAEAAEQLMSYDPESAGGLMTTEYVLLNENMTSREAVQATQRSRESETVAHLFVADDANRLVGYLPLSALVFAGPEERVGDLMEDFTFAVSADTDQEHLVRSATKYDLDVVPVVDTSGAMIGVVTVDDILEAAEQEADEDMYTLAGTGERDPITASVMRSTRLRLPWLLLSVLDGLFIAFILSRNEIASKELLYFLPLIPLMGGQVAVQASTIMVRGIAVGDVHKRMLAKFLGKQFVITLLLSIACAVTTGFLGHAATHQSVSLMMGVASGVFVAVVIAGMLGMTLPLGFARVGIDPAVSAGPFITMLNDLICILIYLVLGGLVASG